MLQTKVSINFSPSYYVFLLTSSLKKEKRNPWTTQSVPLIFNKYLGIPVVLRKKAWPLITVAFFYAWFNHAYSFSSGLIFHPVEPGVFRLISHAHDDDFRVFESFISTVEIYIYIYAQGRQKGKKKFPPSWNNALLGGYVTFGYKTTCFNKGRV